MCLGNIKGGCYMLEEMKMDNREESVPESIKGWIRGTGKRVLQMPRSKKLSAEDAAKLILNALNQDR